MAVFTLEKHVFCSSRRRHTRCSRDWSSDVCFFFSSRRRHTRCSRDWSSDVCSPISSGDNPQARLTARANELADLKPTPNDTSLIGSSGCSSKSHLTRIKITSSRTNRKLFPADKLTAFWIVHEGRNVRLTSGGPLGASNYGNDQWRHHPYEEEDEHENKNRPNPCFESFGP